MKIKASFLIALLAGLALVQPVAAKESGLYIGASIGGAKVKVDDIDFDENDLAWKVFGGYTLGSWLGIEGGYVDFGSASGSAGPVINAKSDITGLDAFAVVGFPIGPVRTFAKLGGIYLDTEIKFDNGTSSARDDGFDVGGGLGLEFGVFSVAVRAEVEYFGALDGLYLATVGATWTF